MTMLRDWEVSPGDWKRSYENLLHDWVTLRDGIDKIILRLNATINATDDAVRRALQEVRDELTALQ